jgi:hypothetical protein
MAVNEITASRAEYALALTALGLKVSSFIPERIVPPVVILSPGSPYLEPVLLDRSEYMMRLDLMVIAATAVNSKASELLDKALETLLNGNPAYSIISSVGQPYALQTNNAEYLAANVSVNLRITL